MNLEMSQALGALFRGVAPALRDFADELLAFRAHEGQLGLGRIVRVLAGILFQHADGARSVQPPVINQASRCPQRGIVMNRRLVTRKELKTVYGIPYSFQHIARLEAAGKFPS